MASNQKSLEEMLRAEVDESKITALVSQLDQPMAQDTGQVRLAAKTVLLEPSAVNPSSHSTHSHSTNTNIVHNSSHSSLAADNNKLKLIVNSQSVTNSTTTANNAVNNNNGLFNNGLVTGQALSAGNPTKLLSQTLSTTSAASLPGALPASGYLTQVTASTVGSIAVDVSTDPISVADPEHANGEHSAGLQPNIEERDGHLLLTQR